MGDLLPRLTAWYSAALGAVAVRCAVVAHAYLTRQPAREAFWPRQLGQLLPFRPGYPLRRLLPPLLLVLAVVGSFGLVVSVI